jgi:NTP pyrophosphatase (non-canonical NTP hydrolase)
VTRLIEINHAEMVQRLAKPGQEIIADLTPQNAHLWHMASCVCGEAGELFDAIKKPAIYAKGQIDRENVIEEMGDLEFYLAGLRLGLGITRSEVLQANMDKLQKRYHKGTYSNDQAQERADKAAA